MSCRPTFFHLMEMLENIKIKFLINLTWMTDTDWHKIHEDECLKNLLHVPPNWCDKFVFIYGFNAV